MIREFEGKNTNEAKKKAAEELNLPVDDLDIKHIDVFKGGLFRTTKKVLIQVEVPSPEQKKINSSYSSRAPRGNQRTADAPRGNQRTADEPQGNQRIADAPRGNQRIADEPRGNQRTADAPRGNQRIADEPRGNQRIADEPRGNQRIADAPRGNQRIADAPRGNQRIADAPRGNQRIADEPQGKDWTPENDYEQAVFDFLLELGKLMNHSFSIHIMERIEREGENECEIVVAIQGNDARHLVGKYGKTLHALQILINAMKYRHKKTSRIVLDINGYWKKRERELVRLTQKKIQRVIETQQAECTPPLYALERKIVHTTVSDVQGLETESLSSHDGVVKQVKIFQSRT